MPQLKMNYRDLLDKVRSMMKTRQDNDVTNRTCMVYTEHEIKLSWLIRSGVIYGEN